MFHYIDSYVYIFQNKRLNNYVAGNRRGFDEVSIFLDVNIKLLSQAVVNNTWNNLKVVQQ